MNARRLRSIILSILTLLALCFPLTAGAIIVGNGACCTDTGLRGLASRFDGPRRHDGPTRNLSRNGRPYVDRDHEDNAPDRDEQRGPREPVRLPDQPRKLVAPAEVITSKAPPGADLRAFYARPTVRFAEFNVMNFLTHDLETGEGVRRARSHGFFEEMRPRSAKDIRAVADAIEQMKADVITLEEVRDKESLDDLNEVLGNRYRVLIVEGNDGRGIKVAMLVKKDLPLDVEYQSHRDEPLAGYPGHSKVFSRDAAVAIFRLPGHSEPFLIHIGIHNKSKRTDGNGSQVDFESNELRELQAQREADMISQYRKQYAGVPVMIGGDFNNSIKPDANGKIAPDLQPLADAGLGNVLYTQPEATRPAPGDDWTHAYFPKGQHGEPDPPGDYTQINGILGSPELPVAKAGIHAYVNPITGQAMPKPRDFRERQDAPSDHRPVWVDVDLQTLLKRYHAGRFQQANPQP